MRNKYFKWLGVKSLGWQRVIMGIHIACILPYIKNTRGRRHRHLTDGAAPSTEDIVMMVVVTITMAGVLKALLWVKTRFKKR